ncbi:hypothetical protein AA0311_1634 [Asaia bogorensis NBRC 16594]|nr:hypothetical protein AA0311_1634 [Asaia bogorensis NBRC 16594]
MKAIAVCSEPSPKYCTLPVERASSRAPDDIQPAAFTNLSAPVSRFVSPSRQSAFEKEQL